MLFPFEKAYISQSYSRSMTGKTQSVNTNTSSNSVPKTEEKCVGLKLCGFVLGVIICCPCVCMWWCKTEMSEATERDRERNQDKKSSVLGSTPRSDEPIKTVIDSPQNATMQ